MSETRITMDMSEKEAQILFVFATAGIETAIKMLKDLTPTERHKAADIPNQIKTAIDLMRKAVEHVTTDRNREE